MRRGFLSPQSCAKISAPSAVPVVAPNELNAYEPQLSASSEPITVQSKIAAVLAEVPEPELMPVVFSYYGPCADIGGKSYFQHRWERFLVEYNKRSGGSKFPMASVVEQIAHIMRFHETNNVQYSLLMTERVDVLNLCGGFAAFEDDLYQQFDGFHLNVIDFSASHDDTKDEKIDQNLQWIHNVIIATLRLFFVSLLPAAKDYNAFSLPVQFRDLRVAATKAENVGLQSMSIPYFIGRQAMMFRAKAPFDAAAVDTMIEWTKGWSLFNATAFNQQEQQRLIRRLAIMRMSERFGFEASEELLHKICQPLTKKFMAADADNTCVVCSGDERGYAAIPCGHLMYCSRCGINLKFCVVCRAPVEKLVRIHT
jgi:hypothetical protein